MEATDVITTTFSKVSITDLTPGWVWSPKIETLQVIGTGSEFSLSSAQWHSHSGTRVGTCPPYLGQGGSWDLQKSDEFFFGGVGGSSGLCMSLKVHRISSMNTSRNVFATADCICISGFWGLCPRPPPGLCPWTPLGDFRPQTPCAHPTSKLWLHHCFISQLTPAYNSDFIILKLVLQ